MKIVVVFVSNTLARVRMREETDNLLPKDDKEKAKYIYTAIGELSLKVADPKQAKHKPVGYDVIATEHEKGHQQNEK